MLVCDFCTSHHDVEIKVLAGLFLWKEREVKRLQLVWVIKYGPRVETSLQNGHIIFNPCWRGRED